MDTTHCISNEIWEGYAQKTLNPADMLILQKHAEECDMCADIKEGIDSLANPATLPQTVVEINAAVDGYLKPKRKKVPLIWYSSAAAILLVALGIGWYNLSAPKKDVVSNIPNIVDTGNSTKNIAIEKQPDSIPTPAIHKLRLKSAPRSATPEAIQHIEKDFSAESDKQEEITTDFDISTNKEANKEFSEDELSVTNESTDLRPAISATPQTHTSIRNNEPVVAKRTSKKRDIYPLGVLNNNNLSNSYMNNNIDYSNTNLNYNTAYQDSANYGTALLYFNESNYDSCQTVLQYITFNLLSPYYQKAQLLAAKSLIKQGKHTEAKALLKAVLFTDEKLKQEADLLLNSIK